jgi:hypothetical protein
MAVQCSKCGAEVPVGASFCAVCGTAVVPGAAPAPPPAPEGSAYAPVNVPGQYAAPGPATALPPPGSGYTSPPPPPVGYAPAANRGGGALKVVLIVVVILVGIGILGAGAVGFVVWRVAHAIHVANRGGQFAFNSPSGRISAGSATNFTPEELGTDIYPGAQASTGGMRMSLPTGAVISAVYLTPDSKDQVLSFYKDKLGSGAQVYNGVSTAMISLKKGSRENIMVTISSRPSENDGKTKISIVHTKNTGAS